MHRKITRQPTVFRYDGKGVNVSNELVTDAGFDLSGSLSDIFAKRIGRIFNEEATNGAVDGPDSVIEALDVAVTTTSPTAITQQNLIDLTGIQQGYREPESQPVFMMNPAVIDYLRGGSILDTAYKAELFTGKLFGYSVVPNVAMPSALTADAKTVVFGSIKRAVLVHSVLPILARSVERFAEYFHRNSCDGRRHSQRAGREMTGLAQGREL